MKAVVLDAETKSALAAIRALGRQGVDVIAGASRPSAMGLHSQYVKEWVVYASPLSNQQQFLTDLTTVLQDEIEPPVVYCFSDATYLSVARHQEQFEKLCVFPAPSLESIEIAFSKERTYELARQLHIPVIPEMSVTQVDHFPVVVKPKHSVSWEGKGNDPVTAEIVFTVAALRSLVTMLETETGEAPLVQEFIIGKEYGVELMCQAGEVQQSFVHERVRSLSPRGGAATVKKTAMTSTVTEQMRKFSAALASALCWTGPMMVEWKVDLEKNQPVLMEINGRFWGSLPLPQAAGVDFVGGYFALASATSIPVGSVLPTLQTQHFLGDCKWLLQVLFKKDPLRHRLYPSRLKAIIAWTRSTLFDRGDVWSFHDPKPFFMEYSDVFLRRK